MDLALFDFDGTITTRDTFVEFVREATTRRRWVYGSLVLAPRIAGYRLRCVSGPCIREDIARVAFAGARVAALRARGEQFAISVIPRWVRAAARDAMRWHRARGDRVVVVSASLDVYLEPWCRANGADVVCTRLETRGGWYTGRFRGGDCSGAAKRERILSRYRLSDYRHVHAYGDTDEDRPMLDLADRRYLCWRAVGG